MTQRIRSLFDRDRAERSVLKFGNETGIYQQKLRDWLEGVQPDYTGLLLLERVFGVPWQWILIGDDGYEAIRAHKERATAPVIRAAEPTARYQPAGRGRAGRAR